MDNEYIKKAEEKLEYLNNDAESRALAEYYADAKRNEISALSAAKEEGWLEGQKAGRLEGQKSGEIKGRLEGQKEGKIEQKIEIIKKMLAKNIDLETISEITNTSTQEILDIKNGKN